MLRNIIWRITSLLLWYLLRTRYVLNEYETETLFFIPVNFAFSRERFNNKVTSTYFIDVLCATSITIYSTVRKCIVCKTGGKSDQTLLSHFGRFEYFAAINSCIFLEYLLISSVKISFKTDSNSSDNMF